MSKLELAVINNYIERFETPIKRKLTLQLINLRGAYLLKLWQKEIKVDKQTAKKQMAKLIVSTLYEEEK